MLQKIPSAFQRFYKTHAKRIFLLLIGFAAGWIGGLIGGGAGILLVFLLPLLRLSSLESHPKSVYTLSLATTCAFSLVTFFCYGQAGKLTFPIHPLPLLLASALGGFAGSLLLRRIRLPYVRLLFGILTIFSGVLTLWKC